MAEFSIQTGLRQSNVKFLKRDRVSIERQTAWIHADVAKNGKALAVPLNKLAVRVLQRQLGKHGLYVFSHFLSLLHRADSKTANRCQCQCLPNSQ